jgi:hypothetical protein
MSQPYLHFYIGDWRKDIAVQSLSYYHRGIWLELLMLMHCSEHRGRLVLAGKPMPNAALARLLGLSEQDVANAVETLVASRVASLDQNGVLFCRRMVREEERRDKLREAGSKGGSQTQAKRQATPYHPRDNDIDIGVEGARSRVREFARGEGIGERDADWFFDKMEGNGWTNGGEPVRDWKATVRSWWGTKRIFPSHQQQQRNLKGFDPPKRRDAPNTVVDNSQRPIREPTEEEWKKSRAIAQEEMRKIRTKFNAGQS